ncbi:hypothetical protein CDAR_464521 [Caerostris darwini]|uniref:Uncharacterized protein n=1 Tax=Caerostris darwini TaxID=1538125 RepID=A0AAV4VVM3_9ARAC|nr:hypothetical protein CDAR_464521 [Caerostris darwini]
MILECTSHTHMLTMRIPQLRRKKLNKEMSSANKTKLLLSNESFAEIKREGCVKKDNAAKWGDFDIEDHRRIRFPNDKLRC